jgi:hypothetical protein
MNEIEKLREAKYFFSKMIKERENWDVFRFSLSAFLSSARSVIQYALAEAEGKTGGQKWYDDWMTCSTILSFFKDKRDFNIHVSPVALRKHIKVEITDVLRLSDSVDIEVRGKNGELIESRHIEEKQQSEKLPEPSAISETRYEFKDWSGTEDVITLCERYIQELEKLVEDGIKRGYISG